MLTQKYPSHYDRRVSAAGLFKHCANILCCLPSGFQLRFWTTLSFPAVLRNIQ